MEMVSPNSFNGEDHWYPKALNATIHPMVNFFLNLDKERIITSTEALELGELPKKMVVIGGGVIGLELGSVYARLGTEVEVVEFGDRIIGTMDKDCSKELTRALKKLGMKFHLKHMVTNVKATSRGVTVEVQKRDTEDKFELKADYCLVAIGRRAYTDNLGLENVGIEKDDRGRIEVNEHLETKVPGIYAIGDVIKGAMLAHKAEEEGVFVAETMAGQKPHINYNLIPGVVYTWPEVAAVGKTEEELKAEGVAYKAGQTSPSKRYPEIPFNSIQLGVLKDMGNISITEETKVAVKASKSPTVKAKTDK